MKIEVNEIKFHAAPPSDTERGLLGWTSFVLNGAVLIEGVALRQTVEGRYYLAFPVRRETSRGRNFWVRPLDDRARRDIEHQVLAALGYQRELQP